MSPLDERELDRLRVAMFALKAAHGAIAGHAAAVHGCYRDFRPLAVTLAKRTELGVMFP